MSLFFAGTVGTEKREIQILHFIQKRLLSFYEIQYIPNDQHFQRGSFNLIKKMTEKTVDLFLDSGAFSAWSQGKTIDIQEYIKFIKEHKEVINIYANLDVIGDPEATWKNQRIMEKAGLHPLPVFHYGEDEKWLLKLLTGKYKYISLGGMVPISTSNLISWLDHLFSKFLTDETGMPNIKVHGFGLTSLPLMIRYPWASVDSTSWVISGRMGSIYIPRYRKGAWIYDEQSWKILVSNRSPATKDQGRHITTLTPNEHAVLLDYIHDKGYVLGKSEFKKESQNYILAENERWSEKKPADKKAKREVEILVERGVSNVYQYRDELNIIYFLDLEKALPEWPWKFKRNSTISFGL